MPSNNNTQNWSSIALLTLVLFIVATPQSVASQYIDECHYECAIAHCDYYADYCDYDCYEVCYPYRSLGAGRTTAAAAAGHGRDRTHPTDRSQAMSSNSRTNPRHIRPSLLTAMVGRFYDSEPLQTESTLAEREKNQKARAVRTGNTMQIKIRQQANRQQSSTVPLPRTFALYKTSSSARNELTRGAN